MRRADKYMCARPFRALAVRSRYVFGLPPDETLIVFLPRITPNGGSKAHFEGSRCMRDTARRSDMYL